MRQPSLMDDMLLCPPSTVRHLVLRGQDTCREAASLQTVRKGGSRVPGFSLALVGMDRDAALFLDELPQQPPLRVGPVRDEHGPRPDGRLTRQPFTGLQDAVREPREGLDPPSRTVLQPVPGESHAEQRTELGLETAGGDSRKQPGRKGVPGACRVLDLTVLVRQRLLDEPLLCDRAPLSPRAWTRWR